MTKKFKQKVPQKKGGLTELRKRLVFLLIGIITTGLKAVDRYLHKKGKEVGNIKTGWLGIKGLAGF